MAETSLYDVISDIREAAGVGARPMLSDLASEICEIRQQRDRLRGDVARFKRGLAEILKYLNQDRIGDASFVVEALLAE